MPSLDDAILLIDTGSAALDTLGEAEKVLRAVDDSASLLAHGVALGREVHYRLGAMADEFDNAVQAAARWITAAQARASTDSADAKAAVNAAAAILQELLPLTAAAKRDRDLGKKWLVTARTLQASAAMYTRAAAPASPGAAIPISLGAPLAELKVALDSLYNALEEAYPFIARYGPPLTLGFAALGTAIGVASFWRSSRSR